MHCHPITRCRILLYYLLPQSLILSFCIHACQFIGICSAQPLIVAEQAGLASFLRARDHSILDGVEQPQLANAFYAALCCSDLPSHCSSARAEIVCETAGIPYVPLKPHQ
jgi:hypothetical protein